MENSIDLSVAIADAEAISVLAAMICEDLPNPQCSLAHAIYALSEHQMAILEKLDKQ